VDAKSSTSHTSFLDITLYRKDTACIGGNADIECGSSAVRKRRCDARAPADGLERMAAKYGIDDEELRELLRAEIERRRVALVGDSPETTPGPHQHGI
jgi:hypothetical protein